MEVAASKSTDLYLYALHGEWRVTVGVAEPNSIYGKYTSKMEQNGGFLLLLNLLFHISSNIVTFETNFRDGFLSEPILCWT